MATSGMTSILEIHGVENCRRCGMPKAARHGKDNSFCSYPHGMIPVKAVNSEHPEGFWSWALPAEEERSDAGRL